MGDFPPQWEHVRDLQEGGQGHTFVVERADASNGSQFVLKRLKNPKRREYFEREIEACTTLDHPNVLKVIEHGETPDGKPFLITEYCADGSLSKREKFDDPGSGLRFFQEIVEGVAHAHGQPKPIYHLDLKPENILLKGETPVVGDFGICFIEDGEVTLTREGPRGSTWYCAPELRDPKISDRQMFWAQADIYSLGKVLYWLFTQDVYDGHEEDYGEAPERKLARRFPSYPYFTFVDELVEGMVQRKPSHRLQMFHLKPRIQQVVERIEAGGHVLDLRIPQQCLYCAAGRYRPAHIHDTFSANLWPKGSEFPEVAKRRTPENPSVHGSIYDTLRRVGESVFGTRYPMNGTPLVLICDFCGNVQFFRLDATSDGHGENWRP